MINVPTAEPARQRPSPSALASITTWFMVPRSTRGCAQEWVTDGHDSICAGRESTAIELTLGLIGSTSPSEVIGIPIP